MTISERKVVPPEFTPFHVAVAAGLETGATMEEIATGLGISRATLFSRMGFEGVKVKACRRVIRPVVKVNKRHIVKVAIEKAEEQFKSRFGAALSALDSALDADDPKTALEAAKETFNRTFGKAAATLNVSGGTTVTHLHVPMTPAQLNAFALDAEDDLGLHKAARALIPQDFTEAEQVEGLSDDGAS